jgi:hypothetical protein
MWAASLRKAASEPEFALYTPALKASWITWSTQHPRQIPDAPEESSFHYTNGACSEFPPGHSFWAFEKHDLN